MATTERPVASLRLRRALLAGLLAVLAWLCIVVLRPFVTPVIWAAIIAYVSWPAFRRVGTLCHRQPTTSAFVMTMLVAVIVIGPLLVLGTLLQDEVFRVVHALRAYRTGAAELPAFLQSIPGLSDALQQAIDRLAGDPIVLRRLIVDWAMDSHDELLGMLGSVGRNIAKLGVALITAFFFYRDGPRLVRQTSHLLARLFGDRLDRYVRAASTMVRAVVFGFLVTAVAQGTIAGIGYAVVGAEAPVTLGALTALASVIPLIGTGLVWGIVAATLMVTGHVWPGIALVAWGTVLVHPVDNLLRPLLISAATQVPYLLVMFGVIGGIAAFGLVGLFIGPVSLAVATAIWREWLDDRPSAPDSTDSRPAPPSGA
jgi:predicted PurR-regulated permease PerM